MTTFSFKIVGPDSDWRWYEEQVSALRGTLKELGHQVASRAEDSDVTIWYNPQKMDATFERMLRPKDVLYNWQQLHDLSPHVNNSVIRIFRKQSVWDYSAANVGWLHARGVSATWVPIGYHDSMRRFTLADRPTTDVAVVGSMNDRRMKVVNDLRRRGISVDVMTNTWGAERDKRLASTRLLLNLHFYANVRICEVARLYYALANGLPVVSEVGQDEALEEPIREAVMFAQYKDLSATCAEALAATEEELRQRGNAAREVVRRLTMLEHIDAAAASAR